jgi:hypothetical protein
MAWLILFYYMISSARMGPFILIIYKILTTDIPTFFIYYGILLLAFTSAVSLFPVKPCLSDTVGSQSIFLTVAVELVQVGLDMYKEPEELSFLLEATEHMSRAMRFTFEFLITLYYFLVVLLLLNLLIGMLGYTYDRYQKELAESLIRIQRSNILTYETHKQQAWKLLIGALNRMLNSFTQSSKKNDGNDDSGGKSDNDESDNHEFSTTVHETKADKYEYDQDDRAKVQFPLLVLSNILNDFLSAYMSPQYKAKVTLLIIDPQHDFHKNNKAHFLSHKQKKEWKRHPTNLGNAIDSHRKTNEKEDDGGETMKVGYYSGEKGMDGSLAVHGADDAVLKILSLISGTIDMSKINEDKKKMKGRKKEETNQSSDEQSDDDIGSNSDEDEDLVAVLPSQALTKTKQLSKSKLRRFSTVVGFGKKEANPNPDPTKPKKLSTEEELAKKMDEDEKAKIYEDHIHEVCHPCFALALHQNILIPLSHLQHSPLS